MPEPQNPILAIDPNHIMPSMSPAGTCEYVVLGMLRHATPGDFDAPFATVVDASFTVQRAFARDLGNAVARVAMHPTVVCVDAPSNAAPGHPFATVRGVQVDGRDRVVLEISTGDAGGGGAYELDVPSGYALDVANELRSL